MDTVSDVMNKLEPELLESCRRHIIKYLLDKRTLHKFADGNDGHRREWCVYL